MKRIAIAFIVVAAGWAANAAYAETCSLTFYSRAATASLNASWTGPCEDGTAHGKGEAGVSNVTYTGHAENGYAHGQGVLKLDNGASYDGAWSEGKFHGYGTAIDADGTKHAGNWRRGKEHGLGTRTNPDGTTLHGRWRDGVLAEVVQSQDNKTASADGRKQETATAATSCTVEVDGERLDWSGPCKGSLATGTGKGNDPRLSYDGAAVDGKAHGQGTAVQSEKNVRYQGAWRGGLQHGFGTQTGPGAWYYQGGFAHGERHGRGTFCHSDGQMYHAQFEKDRIVGGMTPAEGVAAAACKSAKSALTWGDVLDEKSAPGAGPVSREGAAQAEPGTWDGFYTDTGGSESTASPVPGDSGAAGAASTADFGDGISDYEYGLQDLEKREAAAVRAKRNREKYEQQKADFRAREKRKKEKHEEDWWEAERARERARERDESSEPVDLSAPVDDSAEWAREQSQERAEFNRHMFEESQRQVDRAMQMLRQTQRQQQRAYELDTARDALRQHQRDLEWERDLQRMRDQDARERQTYQPVGQGGDNCNCGVCGPSAYAGDSTC